MIRISKVNIAILLCSAFVAVLSLFHFGGFSKVNFSGKSSLSASQEVNNYEKQTYDVSKHTIFDLCEAEEIFEEESHEDKLKSKYNYLKHILFITFSGELPQNLSHCLNDDQFDFPVEQPLYLSNRVFRI